MLRFRVGDRVSVKDTTLGLGPGTGTIIDISFVSKDPRLDDPVNDPRVYVLQLEDWSVRRFTGDEIEPE